VGLESNIILTTKCNWVKGDARGKASATRGGHKLEGGVDDGAARGEGIVVDNKLEASEKG